MSHFKFKVPELPEDALARRKKASNLQLGTEKNINGNESLNEYCMSARSRFTGQFSVFNGVSLRNCNTIQQIRECPQEDHVQPSTSKQIDSLNDKSNKSNKMGRSFGQQRNQAYFGNVFQSRHNFSDIRACKPDPTSNYSQINCFNCGRKSFRDMNFSATHNNNNTSVIKSSTNSSLCYNQGLREMDSSVYTDTQNCTSVNNFHQLSCLNDNQNVFGRSLLPGRDSVFPRNVSVNNIQNKICFKQSACESFNGSSVLRSDKTFNINANTSVTDVQSVMKSFLQISSISMKEEILNKIDSFGQNLLRIAPNLGTTFIGFAKEVESILEKNTKLSGTAETLLSTLICTPRGCQQKSIIQDEKPYEQKIMPKNILSSIITRSKANKLEFITSFTTEKKGEKNNDGKDEFDNKLNFSPTPDKKNNRKEINLKEWYPVVVADTLVFSGKNEENVAYETAAVKERITNRKVLLADGRICNLVGNLSKAQKYPANITRRLRNGLNSKWKTLTSVITAFQKPMRIRNKKSDSAEFDISINTPLRSSGSELLKFVKVAAKSEVTSSKSSSKKEDNNKRKNAGKTKDEVIMKHQKKNATNDQKSAEGSRVLGVTRSGRVIKRPDVMWTGGNFNAERVVSNCREISKSSPKTDSPKSACENESTLLKRKRNASKSDAVKAKKSKPEEEPQTKSSTKTEKNKSRRVNNVLAQNIPVKAEISVAAKKKNQKNHSKKVKNNFEPIGNNPWGNEIEEGLEGIHIPEVPDQKEVKADKNNLNVLGAETPPLQLLRNNLRILRSRTPVQSPDWQISQHTRSEVKKFEKLRAQALRKKIPKENNPKSATKKKSAAQNNDIDTFMNWVSQKEVKSPTKCSKVLKYVMPKKQDLQDEESEDELGNTLEQ